MSSKQPPSSGHEAESRETPGKLEDLARLAGVSVSTVSRALNDSHLVSQKTRKHILELAEQYQYAGRTGFKARDSVQARSVAVVIPPLRGRDIHLSNPFLMELIGGIGDALWEWGHDLVVSHRQPADLDRVTGQNRKKGPGAFIVLGQGAFHDDLNLMAQRGIHFVVWGERLEAQDYCVVGSDNLQGGYRATSHLVRLGRRKIAFVGDPKSGEPGLRFEGYRQALADAGMEFNSRLVEPAQFYPESGLEAVDSLLAKGIRFDGLVAACDTIAIGAMRGLVAHGISVPGDVSVVGYDDMQVAAYCNPPLTTIRQDVVKAGRQLVSKAMRTLNGEIVHSSYLETELVIRNSCGA